MERKIVINIIFSIAVLIPFALGNINCTGDVFKTLTEDGKRDKTPPEVLSVMSTALDKLRVEFSEDVDGVTATEATNYTILGINVTDADIEANPKVVLLTTDVQLNENYDITIENVEDMNGNSMSIYSGSFLGAQNEPRIVSVTAIKVDQIRIEFSEDVDVSSATYTFNPTLTINGTPTYSNPYVTITINEEMQDTHYTVDVDNVQDLEAYQIHPRYKSLSFDGDARPRVAGINSTSMTTIRIKFTEEVDATTAGNTSNYAIAETATPASTLSIVSASRDANDYSVVNITTGNQSQLSYKVTINNVEDSNGNTVSPNTNGYFFGDGPPAIASAIASGPNRVIVTFSESVRSASDESDTATLNPSNYSIGGLSITGVAWPGGDPGDRTVVELSTSTQLQQIYTVFLTADVLEDNSDNLLESGYNTTSFQGDGIPIVTNAVALSNTQIKVIFSEPVYKSIAETTTNYSITAAGFPSPSITNAERSPDPNTNEVTLTVSGQIYVSYTVTASNVEDLTGNTISGNNTAMFAGIGTDNNPPSLISVNANSSTELRVYFNEAVDQTTSEDEGNYFISDYASLTLTVTGAPPNDDETLQITVDNSITGTDSITLTAKSAENTANREFRRSNGQADENALIAYSITSCINADPSSPVRAYCKDNTVVLVSKTFGGPSDTGMITITHTITSGISPISGTTASPSYYPLGGADLATRSPGNAAQVDIVLAAGLTSGIYQLEVQDVADTTLPPNPILSAKKTFIVKSTGDDIPPDLAGIYAVDENHIKLLFNEPVTEISASDKDNFAIEREIAQFTVDNGTGDGDTLTINYNDGSSKSYTVTGRSENDFSNDEFDYGNVANTVFNITRCFNFSPNSPVKAHAEGDVIYISMRTAGSGTISSIIANGFTVYGVSITSADYSNNQTIVSSALNNDFPREVILTLSTNLIADNPTREYVITSTGAGDLNEDTNYNYGGKQISLYLWSGNSAPAGDTEPPYILYVEAISDTMIRVVFNEEINATDAANPSYYSLDNNLQLDPTRNPYRDSNFTNTVIVYTNAMSALTYTLTVTSIRDTSSSQNAIVSNSKAFTGIAAVTVETGPVGNTIYGIGNIKNLAITSMVVYDYNNSDPSDDVIFVGTQNQSNNLGKNSEVYVSENTGVYFTLAATPGFGEEDQEIISSFAVKGSTIYASTKPSAGIDLQVYSVDNPAGPTPYLWSQVTSNSTNNVYTILVCFGVSTQRLYWTFSNQIWCENDWGTILESFADLSTARAAVGFGGKLYIAGSNAAGKMVVIRSRGANAGDPASGDEWEKVLDASNGLGMNGYNGVGDANNASAMSMAVFKGYIYVSSTNAGGAQLWRSQDGLTWDKVRDFGDSSLSAPYYDTGNTRISSMCENGNYLYTGTLNNTDGAEAWRSPDGVSWNQFGSNGFGSDDYTEMTAMVSYRNLIYFGMASSGGGTIFRASN